MSSLPEDIVVNILSRLPVKSILRFRCVCKPWCNLLSNNNPYFVKMHFDHALDDEEENIFGLILRYVGEKFETRVFTIGHNSLLSIKDDTEIHDEPEEIDHPFKSGKLRIVGSCNGLICIMDDEGFICIWNPCTKEYMKIKSTKPRQYDLLRFGFGYDCNSKDYKLVTILRRYPELVPEVRVCTLLESHSWRSIEFIPFRSIREGPGVLLDGRLHWVAFSSSNSDVIISFDIANERSQELQLPFSFEDHYEITEIMVSVLRGDLCTFHDIYQDHVDVWVMKDYGVRESWSKLFTIANDQIKFGSLTPIYSIKNGDEILFEAAYLGDNSGLISYAPPNNRETHLLADPKHEKARILKRSGYMSWYYAVTYVRTFVPIRSGIYAGQEQQRKRKLIYEEENRKTKELKKINKEETDVGV